MDNKNASVAQLKQQIDKLQQQLATEQAERAFAQTLHQVALSLAHHLNIDAVLERTMDVLADVVSKDLKTSGETGRLGS